MNFRGRRLVLVGFAMFSFLLAGFPNCSKTTPADLTCPSFSFTVLSGQCTPFSNPCDDNQWVSGDDFELEYPPAGIRIDVQTSDSIVTRSLCVDSGETIVSTPISYTYSRGRDWGQGTLTLSTEQGLLVSASANSPSVNPGQTVSLTSSVSGGTPPYSFAWTPDIDVASPSSQNTTANPDHTETFSVTVSDAGGQSVTVYVTVNVNLTLSVTANPTLADPMQPTALLAAVSGGTPPFIFSWVPVAPLNSPNVFNPVATPNVTTVFEVTVTDSGSPPAQLTGSVQVQVTLHVAAAATPSAINQGESSTLTAVVTGGSPPYAYSWVPTTGLTNPESASPVASPTVTTVYELFATDNIGTMGHAMTTLTVGPQTNTPPVASLVLTWLDANTVQADASGSTSSSPIVLYEYWPDWQAGENDCVADSPACICFFTAGHPVEGCAQSPDPADGSPEPWLYQFFGTSGDSGDTVQLTIVDSNNLSSTVTNQIPRDNFNSSISRDH